jgi:hypothetical protein
VSKRENKTYEATSEAAITSAATLCTDISLNNGQRRQIARLANSLANMIPSDEDLRSSIPVFEKDLLLSLKQIAENFSCGLSHQTYSKPSVDLTHRNSNPTHELIDTLFMIIKAPDIKPRVWAESAITIAKILEQGLSPNDLSFAIRRIDENASLVISILSTASLEATFESKADDPMASLYTIAAVSNTVLRKMVKRRCTIIAVSRRLGHSDHFIINSALDICQIIFADANCVNNLCTGPGDNLELLVTSILQLIRESAIVQHQLTGIEVLSPLLTANHYHIQSILETLKWVASESKSRDTVVKSVFSFCQAVKEQERPSLQCLKSLVEFSKFPQKEVRLETLHVIDIKVNADNIQSFLEHSELVAVLYQNILVGSEEERMTAFDIARQMARSSISHSRLCSHKRFLEEVIKRVVRKHESPNSSAAEILLSLLLNKENTQYFLQFPSLLPWLVDFVTKHRIGMSDDPLVALIVHLSLMAK